MLDAVAGFILAGGESRRMGTEKSRLVLSGQSFVERIARELSGVTSSVKVVGDKVSPAELTLHPLPIDIQAAPDVIKMRSARRRSRCAVSLFGELGAGGRMRLPLRYERTLRQLASVRGTSRPLRQSRKMNSTQPLCSFYRVEPCLRLAEQLIKSGERKPITCYNLARTRWVLFNELNHLKGADCF